MCIFVFVGVQCIRVSKWVHVRVKVRRVATEIWGVLFYNSPPCWLETASLTELEAHHLGEAAWSISSQNLHVSAP